MDRCSSSCSFATTGATSYPAAWTRRVPSRLNVHVRGTDRRPAHLSLNVRLTCERPSPLETVTVQLPFMQLRLFESEMGPAGGDEFNLIEAGRIYG